MSTWFDMSWLPEVDHEFDGALRNRDLTAEDIRRLTSFRITDRWARKLAGAVRKRFAAEPACAGEFEPLRIALLTDCNLEFGLDLLFVAGLRYGFNLQVMLVEYTDAMAQATDPASSLYQFGPDFAVYAHFGGIFHSVVLTFDDSGADALVEQLSAEAVTVTQAIKAHSSAQILVQNVPATPPDLFGNAERFHAGSFGHAVERLNERLAAAGHPLLDIAQLANRVGLYHWFNDARYHWAKLPCDLRWLPLYTDHLMRKIAASRGRVRKCLVLDLDNTLWGGVIGDDGVDGIVLGNNSPVGEAYLAGQRYYKMLANRGVLLAVCSKNDRHNAEAPFRDHPEMVLRLDDFAMFIANWDDKASNLRAIASALDLGLNSFVFLDDNPVERHLIRRELPEVAVPEVVASDPSHFPRILEIAGYFGTDGLTAEDRQRSADYRAGALRHEVLAKATDLSAYLRALDMHFRLEPVTPINDERVVQLINRSNQFNLTTRRYTASDIVRMRESLNCRAFSVRLSDRFADSGMIAVLICRDVAPATWEIDTWLMSCRVLGRRVEEGTLKCLSDVARAHHITRLRGRYIPTAKNAMVKDHYLKLGFARVDALDDGETVWELNLQTAQPATPDDLPFHFD